MQILERLILAYSRNKRLTSCSKSSKPSWTWKSTEPRDRVLCGPEKRKKESIEETSWVESYIWIGSLLISEANDSRGLHLSTCLLQTFPSWPHWQNIWHQSRVSGSSVHKHTTWSYSIVPTNQRGKMTQNRILNHFEWLYTISWSRATFPISYRRLFDSHEYKNDI